MSVFSSPFRVEIFTPTLSGITITAPIEKTEINAAGIQVVGSTTRYVRMARSGSDAVLQVYGIIQTNGSTSDIRSSGNVTAYYSSDERLKENIKPIDSPLEKIEKINGVYFDWNDKWIEQQGGEDTYFVRKKDVGVIAQEVEKVLEEVVATREDGFKAVKYEKIVPLLIEAIKEQNKIINEISASFSKYIENKR
jgi:hypothetical protein